MVNTTTGTPTARRSRLIPSLAFRPSSMTGRCAALLAIGAIGAGALGALPAAGTGAGLMPVAAAADGEAQRELHITWNADTPESVPNGSALVAKVTLNSNLPEGVDADPQTPEQRTAEVRATGGTFVSLPSECEPGSEIAEGGALLKCIVTQTHNNGGATAINVPVRAWATSSGQKVQLTATESGNTSSTDQREITIADEINLATSWAGVDMRDHSIGIVAGVWLPPDASGPDATGVSFDIDIATENGHDFIPEIAGDFQAVSGTGSLQSSFMSKDGNRVFSPGDGSTWTVSREGNTLHVTVISSPDPTKTTFLDGTDAAGATQYATAYIKAPLAAGVNTAQEGRFSATIKNVRYISSVTGQTITTESDMTDNRTESTTQGTGVFNSRITEGVVSAFGDASQWGAPADGAWSGTSETLPGGVNAQIIQTHLGANEGPLDYTWILPAGQQASYTGDVTFTETTLDASGVQYLYYTSPIPVSDIDRAALFNSDEGWSATKPAQGTAIYGIKAKNVGITGKYGIQAAYAKIKVEDGATPGQWVWVNGGVHAQGSGRSFHFGRTESAASAWAFDPSDDGLDYKTGVSMDAFKIGQTRSYGTINFTQDQVKIGAVADLDFTMQVVAAGSGGEGVIDSDVTMVLQEGLTYEPGSSTIGEPTITLNEQGRQVLTWKQALTGTQIKNGSLKVKVGAVDASTLWADLTVNVPSMEPSKLAKFYTWDDVSIDATSTTGLTKTTAGREFAINANAGANKWYLDVSNDTAVTQAVSDVIDILPFAGDWRGNTGIGATRITELSAGAGGEVYITKAEASTLVTDPGDAKNSVDGQLGKPTDIWQRWDGNLASLDGVSGVRFIAHDVPGATQYRNTIGYEVSGVFPGQQIVNSAGARATTTELKMIESADTVTAGNPSALQVDKAVSTTDQPLAAGRTITFNTTVKASENGNGDTNVIHREHGGRGLTNIQISNPSKGTVADDGVTWNVGNMVAGEVQTATVTATITDDYDGGGITNTVTVEGDRNEAPTDPSQCVENTGDVTSDTDQCDIVELRENSRLKIDKRLTDGQGAVKVGDEVVFDVDVLAEEFDGATTAADVVAREFGGAGLADVTFFDPTTGTVSADGTQWNIGDMKPGQLESVKVRAKVTDTSAGVNITNTVVVENPEHPAPNDPLGNCEENSGDVSTDADQCDVVPLDKAPTPTRLAKTGATVGGLLAAAAGLVGGGAFLARRRKSQTTQAASVADLA